MDHVHKAFGDSADLYEVLGLTDRDEAENPAKLRKAYFRKALVYHPDKTKEKDTELAKEKFQAISFAYEILKNPEKRAEYNETGHVEEGDADDDSNDGGAQKDWKAYFDRIFGKVTTSKIDQFALKYKCSEEEQRDVLKEYKKFKGDLVKMLEYVMLSEPRDAKRWVEDYIKPAIEAKEIADYDDKIQSSLKKIDKKIEAETKKKKSSNNSKPSKGNKQPESDEEEEEDEEMSDDEENNDSEATITESEEESPQPAKKKKKGTEKVAAKKAKPTKAKPAKKKGKGKEEDLFAMIQANGAKRSGDLIASLGARYGVQMDDEDDDPLNDAEFEKIQARMSKKKKAR